MLKDFNLTRIQELVIYVVIGLFILTFQFLPWDVREARFSNYMKDWPSLSDIYWGDRIDIVYVATVYVDGSSAVPVGLVSMHDALSKVEKCMYQYSSVVCGAKILWSRLLFEWMVLGGIAYIGVRYGEKFFALKRLEAEESEQSMKVTKINDED